MTFDLEFFYEFLWNVIDYSDIDDDCCCVLFEFETILGEYNCIIKQPAFRPQWYTAIATKAMEKVAYILADVSQGKPVAVAKVPRSAAL